MRSLAGVEILESGLVMASAAECLTPDLPGKDFDTVSSASPAERCFENFELEWLSASARKLRNFLGVPQVQQENNSLERIQVANLGERSKHLNDHFFWLVARISPTFDYMHRQRPPTNLLSNLKGFVSDS
jgi:hypothetical protein